MMLELYHTINSVCAQKVRIALTEKKLEYQNRLMKLGGDQFDPAYVKLNPNAVVPTLVHDGRPIIESSVILFYLDDTFIRPPLTPKDSFDRARMRLFIKLIDEYIHDSCTVITFATAFRANALRMTIEQFEANLAKAPNRKRSESRRDVIASGLDSKFVAEALRHHEKLLSWIDESVGQGAFLAGETYSLADIAVIPYVIRLDLLRLSKMWDSYPGVAKWYETMRCRPSTDAAIFNGMTEADWAPFKQLSPDPWLKVSEVLAARSS